MEKPTRRVCMDLSPRTFIISSDTDALTHYTVYLGAALGQETTCTCLGFGRVKPNEYGVKQCKHIRRLLSERCLWAEGGAKPIRPSGRCPECGNHTVEVPTRQKMAV